MIYQGLLLGLQTESCSKNVFGSVRLTWSHGLEASDKQLRSICNWLAPGGYKNEHLQSLSA